MSPAGRPRATAKTALTRLKEGLLLSIPVRGAPKKQLLETVTSHSHLTTAAAHAALVARIHGPWVDGVEKLFANAPNGHIQITQAFSKLRTGHKAGQRAKFICPWKPAPKMRSSVSGGFSGFFTLVKPKDPVLQPISDSSMK